MTLTNLQAKVLRLLGNITTTELPAATSLQSLNEYYHKAIAIAMQTMGEWEINAFEATTDLVAEQEDYSVPADILRIYRIEANFTGVTNNWRKIKILDQSEWDFALTNQHLGFGPLWARLFSDHMYLKPIPTLNVTAGLKIYYSDQITELSSGSDEPNIPEHIVNYLYYGACLDYCIENKINDQTSYFESKLDEGEAKIKTHYSRRLEARKFGLRRKYKRYN